MSEILTYVAFYVSQFVAIVNIALAISAFLIIVWALLDTLVRPANLFPAASRLSKSAGIGVHVGAARACVVLGGYSFFGMIAVAASAVYLAGVRPQLVALSPARVRSKLRVIDDDDRNKWRS